MGNDPGVYQLYLYLAAAEQISVGRLGVFIFPPGRYVYTGSALSGLEGRLARHRRREKKRHWHIDYLVEYAVIESITVLRTRERRECALNATALALPGARVIVA